MSTNFQQLNALGQSVWLDNLSRAIIEDGTLEWMIDNGLSGITSNPTIFEKAISGSDLYDSQINALASRGNTPGEIYDAVTIKDIQDSSDLLRGQFIQSGGSDGYVSLEINPHFAGSAKDTFETGKELKTRVNRPNVMFKVPGTPEGNIAIEELTAAGVNVNVTLLFSVEQYRKSAEAYLKGVRRLIERGGNPGSLYSVASIFVSRIDTVIDKMIETLSEQGKRGIDNFKGTAAVANCVLCYEAYREIFGKSFDVARDDGANIQRLLWGSTGAKNPLYSDIKYVTELIGRDTVSTMPEYTFQAFLDHGVVKEALPGDARRAAEVLAFLKDAGIDINKVSNKLQSDGIETFKKSYDSLLGTIENKSRLVLAR